MTLRETDQSFRSYNNLHEIRLHRPPAIPKQIQDRAPRAGLRLRQRIIGRTFGRSRLVGQVGVLNDVTTLFGRVHSERFAIVAGSSGASACHPIPCG
jgi:hypothetical protein